MVLKKEEVKELKEQLKAQVQGLPEEKKKEALDQIDKMSDEAMESMLEQQKANQIFRAIAEKRISSVVVEENDIALAVLELNPISKGHCLIIPKGKAILDRKEFSDKLAGFMSLVSKKIESKLRPKKIHVFIELKMGEVVGDLVPEYDKAITKDSERISATQEDLVRVRDEINKEVIKSEKKKEIIKKEKKEEKKEILKLKRKIP